MAVSDHHRRRWDEPRVSVEVPREGEACCGEVEARRRRDGHWEAWVRCTEDQDVAADACSGWFAWDDVAVIEVRDVTRRVSRGSPSR